MKIDQSLVLYPQITLCDLKASIGPLDVGALVHAVGPLAWTFDAPNGLDEALIRCLHDVPLADDGSFDDVLAPYIWAGVDRRWLRIIKSLRVRGRASSAWLAHREAVTGADFIVASPGRLVAASRDAPRRVVLRPLARTLGVSVPRYPGGPELGKVPPDVGGEDAELEQLADVVGHRIRATPGGKSFVDAAPHVGALAVLAATVATILENDASQRWLGHRRVVRADVYRLVFEQLELGGFFNAARRFLEADHPRHYRIDGPWPPGCSGTYRDLSVLEWRDGFLVLRREARLPCVWKVSGAPLVTRVLSGQSKSPIVS